MTRRFNMIEPKSAGATHLGYGCEWQNSWIEDHPDGHSHLPGEAHHDCPHLHVYKSRYCSI